MDKITFFDFLRAVRQAPLVGAFNRSVKTEKAHDEIRALCDSWLDSLIKRDDDTVWSKPEAVHVARFMQALRTVAARDLFADKIALILSDSSSEYVGEA